MAKVRNNLIMQGLSGSLGNQLVIRQDKAGRTILSAKPAFDPNRQYSEAQIQQQEAFREAVAYAKVNQNQAVYAEKAEDSPNTPYNVAVADWFHPPEILAVDLSAWTGEPGEIIRVKVLDDVQVTQVSVAITDENDAVIEAGVAAATDGLWWGYTTTATANGNSRVVVSAQDLPGHITEATHTP